MTNSAVITNYGVASIALITILTSLQSLQSLQTRAAYSRAILSKEGSSVEVDFIADHDLDCLTSLS